MQIYGHIKTTLLDYPGHVAATLFTGNCNFRCPFCHNSDLVVCLDNAPLIPEKEVLSLLRRRAEVWDGVCITGGEPTLQTDLINFARKLKEFHYSIKLDTNGSQPEVLKTLILEKLVDYVAMDIKNSPVKYAKTCGLSSLDLSDVKESVSFLMQNHVPYEFRTTVVRELHNMEDLKAIGEWIQGARAYFLQSYRESDGVMKKEFSSYSKEELEEMKDFVRPFVPNVELRGIE